jgi:hypothetical protein
VMHPQLGGNLPQSLAAGCKEAAQQPATPQLLQLGLSALHAAAQPIEDS